MLKRLSDVLSPFDQLSAIIRFPGLCAIDPETGALLKQTAGQGKDGLPKFVLILPNKTPAERSGLLADYRWDYPHGRKIIRAWTDTTTKSRARLRDFAFASL
jgi:hypothetical protein